ncbi:MAG: HD domain-containing protein, partial [Spirochaetales bacterium]|nr:HD domain-containing protein [Spirochaetales bacterium]
LDEAIAKKEVFARENETLNVLGRASDYKDPETGAHIVRVSCYSRLLSESLGQSEALQDLIFYAAPLHDIGKLGIPDSILLKPGKLTSKEFEIIKTHTTIGFKILANPSSKYLKAGAVIAVSHHEKFDGTGYTKGLKGDEIPIFGRIVSIADVFDALTTKRPYKDPWLFEKVVGQLIEERGRHFDPEIVDLFMENISKVKKIYDNENPGVLCNN